MEIWQFIILAVLFFSAFFIGTALLANMAIAWVAGKCSQKARNQHVQKLEKCLPGKDCGQCGYESCKAYAEAVFYGRANEDKCTCGEEDQPEKMKKIVADFIAYLESGESIEDLKKSEKERRFKL